MLDLHSIDYRACHEYARELGFKYGIPKGDWADIGSDAFLLAIRRAWRATADTNPEAYAKRLMYTAVIDVIRRRNTRSQTVYLDSSPVVEPDENDDNPDDEPLPSGIVLGDNGKGAETTRTFDEEDRPHLWLGLFENERRRLRREGKRLELLIIRLGLKDSRLWAAQEKLKISGKRFRTILNFLQVRFALCFQALQAWRSHLEQTRFRR